MSARRQRNSILRSAGAAAALAPALACAQIATDGSLGAATALSGPNFAIPASLGRQAGANLFHSFATFGVPRGGSATFSGPAGISNIVSRVTGGSPSSIDGQLASSIAGANLYLLNPSGILFGRNATLNVSGAVHASTASYLRFADGTRFDATTATPPPLLSIASPEAFGFLGGNGDLNVAGSRWSLAGGRALDLSGANVTVSGSALLRTRGADLRLAAVSSGELPVDARAVVPSATAFGRLDVTGAQIEVIRNGAVAPGRLVIRGGEIAIANTRIFAENATAADAQPIEILGSEAVTISGGEIVSGTRAAGRGADIVVRGGQVRIDGGASVNAWTSGAGAGGAIDIAATGAVAVAAQSSDPGYTSVYTYSEGPGAAGPVRVNADRVVVDAALVGTEARAAGAAGAITMNAREVELANGGYVYSAVQPGAAGDAVGITLTAGERIAIAGADWNGYPSEVRSSTDGPGRGASVTLRAPDVRITDGGFIEAVTSAGPGGAIALDGDTVTVRGGNLYAGTTGPGEGGPIRLTGREVSVLDGAVLQTYAWYGSSGRAGDIEVRAGERLLATGVGPSGDPLFILSRTFGTGGSGNIILSAPDLTLRGGIIIAGNYGSSGDAGSIRATGDVIRFQGGNGYYLQVESGASDFTTGNGGNIEIRAAQRFELDGSGFATDWTRVAAATQGDGRGGDILVEAPSILIDRATIFSRTRFGTGQQGGITLRGGDLLMRNEGSLTSSAEGAKQGSFVLVDVKTLTMEDTASLVSVANENSTGGAGPVTVLADRVTMKGSSYITTDAAGSGPAGNIVIDARERFEMTSRAGFRFLDLGGGGPRGQNMWPGGVLSRGTGPGDAGSILLRSPNVLMDSGRILATVAGSGQGGRIEVQAGNLALLNGSQIDAKALPGATGSAGEITINVGNRLEISGASPVDALASGINTETSGPGRAGSIRVRAATALIDRGFITSSTASAGDAGTIDIAAAALTLGGGARVDASATAGASGRGGNVRLVADERIALSDPGTVVATSTAGVGAGGRITISAPEVTVASEAQVTATTSGAGAAGRIDVTADRVVVASGGRVEAQALAGSSGAGGDVSVAAAASILVAGQGSAISTSTAGTGAGGVLKLSAPSIAVLDGAQVAADSTGSGAGGAIALDAARVIEVGSGATVAATSTGDGAAGRIDIQTDRLSLADGGVIDARTLSSDGGAAGSIVIRARQGVTIDGASSGVNAETAGHGAGGGIRMDTMSLAMNGGFVKSSTRGLGRAGDVDITAGDVRLGNGARVDASALPGSSGAGGDVHIQSSGAILASGAGTTIATSSAGSGPGGEVTLTASTIALTDGASVAASSTGAGDGGAITLAAQRVDISSGATVAATSSGTGAAGRIDVRAVDALYLYGGAITTDSSAADGGNIDIRAGRMIHLRGGEISTSVAGGAGAGGNIFIDPTFVVLDTSSRIAANAFGGPGGNITLIADYFFASIDSLVQASSALGLPGTITIASPQNNVNSTLAKLPAAVLDASALLRDTCGARAAGMGGSSSLVDVGRGGLAASPERLTASRYFAPAAPQLAPGPAPADAPRVAAAERARLAACAAERG